MSVLITDKILKRILLCLLAMTLLLMLIACGKSKDVDKYEGIFSPEELDWDAEHEYATYAVVVPSKASFALYEAAECIADKLSENTGAYSECFYAHEDISKGNDVCRILIGDVGFEDMSKYLKGFRSEDIGYKYHNKTVYIGGITETSLLSAIAKFTDDIVVYADRGFFMNEDTEVFLGGEYEVGQIKLDGFSLGEYTLVYPKGNDRLRVIANDFRDEIFSSSGYLLSVCSDSELRSESRVILLGDCDVFKEYRVKSEPNIAKIVGFDAGLMVVSDIHIPIRMALDALAAELYDKGDTGYAGLIIDYPIEIAFGTTDVSVLSFCPDSYEISHSTMTSIAEKIMESYPDVIRLERVSADSVQSLIYNFADKYELISLSNNTYHMIRKDKYEYGKNTADGVDALKYKHISAGAEFNVLEIGEATNASIEALNSILSNGGASIVFSNNSLSSVGGVESASVLFDQIHSGGMDMLYFAGDTISPCDYDITDLLGFTCGYAEVKIFSLK